MKKIWIALLAIAALVLVGAPAHATSESPPPYEVGVEGITLPQGEVFKPHGHVNIQFTDSEGINEQSAGVHFDPNNNQPGGAWIGERFIPWSAFGLESDFCVTWVQIHGFNQHYGEGKHKPVCVDPPVTCVDDPAQGGCEIPVKPESWHDQQARTSDLVCEPDATGFGIVTIEMRDGVREPVWNATSWAWVTPTDWTWGDWYVTGEERVEDAKCDPIAATGGVLSPAVIGTAVALFASGAIVLLVRRRETA